MAKSMTAFARVTRGIDNGTLICEIRSVNHRYLELNLKLPDDFKPLENQLRNRLQQQIERGKVEVTIKYNLIEGKNSNYQLNRTLFNDLKSIFLIMQSEIKDGVIDLTRLIFFPQLLQGTEVSKLPADAIVLELLDETITELNAVRLREGKALAAAMLPKFNEIETLVAITRTKVPELLITLRDTLRNKINELKIDCDPVRLEQELVFYAQRMDNLEELDRLSAHVDEAKRLLTDNGTVGKKLDFLMQEFNREANTLAAKATTLEITKIAVELKVIIEQLREQIQNLL